MRYLYLKQVLLFGFLVKMCKNAIDVKNFLVFGKENIIAEFVVEYFVQIVQIDGALYQVW